MSYITNKQSKSIYIYIYRLVALALVLMIPMMLSGFLFRNASADSVNFSVAIDPSLNITIPTNLVTLDLNPSTNAFAAQNLTVSVGTNNPTGYTLTMNSSSTSLTRTEMVGSSYPTISTLTNEVAENDFTPNRWGYRFNDSVNTNYQPFATSIAYNSSTEAVDNDARTVSFAAKVDTEQAPGTYELDLDFTAVTNPLTHDCTKRYRLQNADGTWGDYTTDTIEEVAAGSTCTYTKSVTNYKGTADGTNNASATTSGTMDDTGITLSLDFYRNTFALTVNKNTDYVATAAATTEAVHGDNYYRWGQGVDIEATLTATGTWPTTIWSVTGGSTGTFANAGSASTTYTMPNGASTIYANAEKSGPSTIADLEYLQDFAALDSSQKATILGTMTANTNYTLKDKRDEQDYTIARLTGTVTNSNYSQVWMTKNLNLAGGTALDSTTTDMPSNYTMPTGNGFQTGNKLPNSSTSGFSDNATAYVYNSNRTNCSSPGCYSYYSWTAATLGSGLSESGDGTDVTTASICPKGWRLPTSGNQTSSSANSWKKGDFYKMATAYGANLESQYYQNSSTFYNNAGPNTTVPDFLLAGGYHSGSFNNGGSYGYYWSSSSRSSTNAYYLGFNSSGVSSANSNLRRYGFSVRCVLVAE